jgi:hypothetical protein
MKMIGLLGLLELRITFSESRAVDHIKRVVVQLKIACGHVQVSMEAPFA